MTMGDMDRHQTITRHLATAAYLAALTALGYSLYRITADLASALTQDLIHGPYGRLVWAGAAGTGAAVFLLFCLLLAALTARLRPHRGDGHDQDEDEGDATDERDG